jgi:hypothetical protein
MRQREMAISSPRVASNVSTGYVNELLAVADLNARCGVVGGWAYLNPAPQTKDDAFANTSVGWKTVQVKTAALIKRRDGSVAMQLRSCSRSSITSDILVLVDDRNMRVKYIANNGALPPELPDKPAPICKDIIFLNNPEAPDGTV